LEEHARIVGRLDQKIIIFWIFIIEIVRKRMSLGTISGKDRGREYYQKFPNAIYCVQTVIAAGTTRKATTLLIENTGSL